MPDSHVEICSEYAVCLRFDMPLDEKSGSQIMGLLHFLRENPLPGQEDLAPGLNSLTLFFDPEILLQHIPRGVSPVQYMADRLVAAARMAPQFAPAGGPPIEIPVRYGGDLGQVCAWLQMSEAQFIQVHAGQTHTVLMNGFLPGFAYMGWLDPALRLPRKSVPSLRVPAGSVAIAAEFTGIYPAESPGGWHLIGSTDLAIFDVHNTPPNLLTPGKTVRFIPV